MLRIAGVLAAAAAFLAGCSREHRLEKEQRQLVPPSFELVDCEFASGLYGLVSPPASYCVYLVAETKQRAAAAMEAALLARGYALDSGPYADAIELKAHRSGFNVQVRIGKSGVGPHLVPDPIPAGHVAASVTVGEPES